ncbi:MAG TPA: ABC transporter permease [Longimicrobiales bacterium]|nr:ABC transporter permease [Longimicrobiales bacterium]
MGWIEGIRRQLRLRVTPRDMDEEVADELRFHIETRVEELVRAGASPADARARAHGEFGDVAAAQVELSAIDRQRARDERRAEVMGDVIQDVRFATRTLLRARTFTVTAVLTLALAVGVTTGLVAVVDQTLLRPLPFAAPDELVVLNGVALPERDIRGGSYVEVNDWGALTNSFTAVSIYSSLPYNLSDGSSAVQVMGEVVSASYLGLLGVTPQLGRDLEPADDVYGAPRVVLISHDLWQSRFGGALNVLERTIELDATTATVIGVLPRGFRGLSFEADVWLPLLPYGPPTMADQRGGRWLGALARLRAGVPRAAAEADAQRAAAELTERYPDTNTNRSVDIMTLRDSYLINAEARIDTRSLLLAVAAAVGMLLLIAIVNVTNLQLVRGLSRTDEVAVRYALGAGRGRIVRQLVTESLVLSLTGGALGIALAIIGTRAIVAMLPAAVLPPYAVVAVDARVIAIALAVVVVTGVLSGLVPAFRTSGERSAGELRVSRAGGRRSARLQHSLVIGEVALAVALLAVGALMVRSLRAQLAIDPSFDARNVTIGRVMLIGDAYDTPGRARFVQAVTERLQQIPGVAAAAIGSDAPLRGNFSASFIAPADNPDARLRYYRHRVTPSYFSALGIPILRGRGLEETDRAGTRTVVVVSDAFAQRVFENGDALGRRLVLSSQDTVTVVGIAANVRQRVLTTSLFDPGEDPDVYFAWAQQPVGGLDIIVRGASAPVPAAALHAIMQDIAPEIPLFNVEPLETTLAAQTANARFGSLLLGSFAFLALGLAAVGLYGVMAFLVHARRREIAVRMAIGAAPRGVVAIVLKRAMLLVLAGSVLGILLALGAGRVLTSILYGVRPVDPPSLAAAALTLAACAALATLVPALRAVRTDPQLVLRAD